MVGIEPINKCIFSECDGQPNARRLFLLYILLHHLQTKTADCIETATNALPALRNDKIKQIKERKRCSLGIKE